MVAAFYCALNASGVFAQSISNAPLPPFTTTQNGSVKAPGSVVGNFLGDDGNFHAPTGSGTVTEQKNTFGYGLSSSGIATTRRPTPAALVTLSSA